MGQWKATDVHAIYWAYPRHVGKRAALAAIERALTRLAYGGTKKPVGYLLRRTKQFAASPVGQKGEFTPHPTTWFNNGRYEDDPAEWQKGKATQPNRPMPRWRNTEADHAEDMMRYARNTGQPLDPQDQAIVDKYYNKRGKKR